jgi:transcriptional regulator with XRE-family HTH domain
MERLKEFRKEKNMTQEGMAEKIGITLSMYEKVERGVVSALFLKDHGKVLVDRWELKDHDGGDKIYLVIPEYNPRKILLYYNADHYEPGR